MLNKKLLSPVINLLLIMSLVLGFLAAFPSYEVQAATLTVCPGTCTYTSIQSALNAAAAGDTVYVKNGTYSENLVITKAVTLTGESRSGVIINVPANGNYGFSILASSVTLEKFTLRNGTSYGIKPAGVSNFTVQSVTVQNTGRSGIDFNGVNTGLIFEVTSTGAAGGVGIALTDSNNITVRNVTTSGNAWGGLAIYTWGEYYPGGSTGIKIIGSNSFGEINPFYIETGNYSDPTNPYPVTNLQINNALYLVQNTDLPNYTFYQNTYANAYALAISIPTASPTPRNSSIREVLTGDYLVQTPLTITAAIAAATNGNTIRVYPGIYNENPVVNKRLSIIGSGSGINPVVDTILRKNAASTVLTISASGLSALEPVLLQNLRVEPQGVSGINIASLDFLKLDNVHVVGTALNAFNESESCLKVATTANITNLKVVNSAFDQCDYGWYIAKHGDWGPGGSNVQFVTVSNTTFNDNDYKGLYIEKLSDATFENVTVNNNGHSDFWNQIWNGGVDINLKGEELYQNLVFNNMTVTGNGLGYKEGAGMMIKARDDGDTYGAHPASLDNVQINGGSFTGNERGIRFGEPGKNNATPTNAVIRFSDISNNTGTYSGTDGSFSGGVINHTLSWVDARSNWWGDVSGPFHTTLNPLGSGNAVSDLVLFDPWMTGVDIWTMPDSYEVAEDGSLIVAAAGVLTNDLDATGDPLTAINFTDPAHGTLTGNADGSFSYQPDADYAGDDSFTYQASDGVAVSQVVNVSLTITPVNDAPTATADSYEINENIRLLVTAAEGVLNNDNDIDSANIEAMLQTDVQNGILTLNSDGSFDYMPNQNYVGPDSFTYLVSDGELQSEIVTVTISVLPGIPVSGETFIYLPLVLR